MEKIYIIGGCNIDILGAVHSTLRLRDSNPGKISYSYGGVARNVAENLARLEESVFLVSVLGNDVFGDNMYQYCEENGIDMRYCLRSETYSTSTYLAILDDEKDMYTAVVDTSILSLLSKEYLKGILDMLDKEDILVIDTNLETDLIDYIVEHCHCRIYLDPISTKKAEKVKDILNYFYFMKPNVYEAELLSGIKLETVEDEKKILDYFLQQGVKEIVISRGDKGVIATDGSQYLRVLHEKVLPVNATGAGDSYMAAYIWARGKGESFEDGLKTACAVAICTILDSETVAKELSCDKIEQVKKKMNIRGENIC